MSDRSPGWFGITTSALVVVAVPSLAQWLFPNWDSFFSWGARLFGSFWNVLTAQWSVPAIPLIAILIAACWQILSLLLKLDEAKERTTPIINGPIVRNAPPRALTETAEAQLSVSEADLLRQLLHADPDPLPGHSAAFNSRHPRLVLQAAAQSLQEKGFVHLLGRDSDTYALTPAGKKLVIRLWNEHSR